MIEFLLTNEIKMFITVAVSEAEECLFNPDCMINVLLAAIKKKSNIPKRGNYVTCSYDSSNFINIVN